MISKLIKLADVLDRYGFYKQASQIDKLIKTAGVIASLNYPIILENGNKQSIFHHNVQNTNQLFWLIPDILSKTQSRIWYKGQKFELPVENKLLAKQLHRDLNNRLIICEEYVGESAKK
jgi:hypothetical protein